MNTNTRLSDTQLAILAHGAARDDLTVLPTPATLKARGGALQVVLTSLIDRGLIEERETAGESEWRRDEEGRRLTLKVASAGLTAIGLGGEEMDSEGGAAASATTGASSAGDGAAADATQGAGAVEAGEGSGAAAADPDEGAQTGDREPEASADRDDAGPAVGEPAAADPDAAEPAAAGGRGLRPGTTGAGVLAMLQREGGASVPEMIEASGWQAHSVRGFLSGTVKKKLGLEVTSERDESGERRYRVA